MIAAGQHHRKQMPAFHMFLLSLRRHKNPITLHLPSPNHLESSPSMIVITGRKEVVTTYESGTICYVSLIIVIASAHRYRRQPPKKYHDVLENVIGFARSRTVMNPRPWYCNIGSPLVESHCVQRGLRRAQVLQ